MSRRNRLGRIGDALASSFGVNQESSFTTAAFGDPRRLKSHDAVLQLFLDFPEAPFQEAFGQSAYNAEKDVSEELERAISDQSARERRSVGLPIMVSIRSDELGSAHVLVYSSSFTLPEINTAEDVARGVFEPEGSVEGVNVSSGASA